MFYSQALMDHGTRVAKELVSAYGRRCSMSVSYPASRDATIDLGLKLGKILSFILHIHVMKCVRSDMVR
jgi:hypothetical protein